jgi:hypothetical protein
MKGNSWRSPCTMLRLGDASPDLAIFLVDAVDVFQTCPGEIIDVR